MPEVYGVTLQGCTPIAKLTIGSEARAI